VSNTKTETRGNVLHVELMHPRIKGNVDTVEVNLCDVRAADGIRIRYDFARDGWSILQASRFDWQEVAFVQAWAREVPEEPET
jgi:hypothetical protein